MPLVSYVFEKPLGSNKEGDVVSLEPDEAEGLVSAGVLAEATAEHLQPQEEEPEEEVTEGMGKPGATEEAVCRAIQSGFKSLQATLVKSAKAAVTTKGGGKLPNVNGTVPATTKEPIFKSLGELVKARYKAGHGDYQARNRLAAWEAEASKKSPAGANEGTSAQGGYAVIPEWTKEIFSKIKKYPDLLSMTDRQTISGNTLNIPAVNETSLADGSRGGGILAYWTTEGSTVTTSYPQLTQVQAILNTQVVIVPVSNQLLEDNAYNLDSWLKTKVGEEYQFQHMDMVIAGSGSGQPKGILNQASLVSVAKESGQTAATVVYPNITKMWARIFPGSRSNSVWLVNPQVYQQLLAMTFPNSSGTYPAFGGLTFNAHDEFQLRIFGRPVLECLAASPQVGLVGDIILADLSQLTCAEHAGMQVDVSDQVYFTSLQTLFRFIRRYDIQSPWTATLSDGQGATYSPFVTLASRGT